MTDQGFTNVSAEDAQEVTAAMVVPAMWKGLAPDGVEHVVGLYLDIVVRKQDGEKHADRFLLRTGMSGVVVGMFLGGCEALIKLGERDSVTEFQDAVEEVRAVYPDLIAPVGRHVPKPFLADAVCRNCGLPVTSYPGGVHVPGTVHILCPQDEADMIDRNLLAATSGRRDVLRSALEQHEALRVALDQDSPMSYGPCACPCTHPDCPDLCDTDTAANGSSSAPSGGLASGE